MIKNVILPNGYGQTCNQLLQIAHWIPVVKEFGMSLYFPGFRKYAHMFVGTNNQSVPSFPSTALNLSFSQSLILQFCSYGACVPNMSNLFFKLASILPSVVTVSVDDSGSKGSIDPKKVVENSRIAGGESLWVKGWLYRDYIGMAKHKTSIKEFFSPIPQIKNRVDDCIRKSLEENVLLVGVHLRRGDYCNFAGGKYYYDDDTVRGLMRQLSNLLSDRHIRFLLVSNQPVDRKKYDGFDIVIGPGDPAADLFSLTECDYIIGPPSTFTIWASFYGDVPLFMIKDPSSHLYLSGFTVCAG
jgi:hypothetical protein